MNFQTVFCDYLAMNEITNTADDLVERGLSVTGWF